MSGAELLTATAVVAVGAIVQGSVGFGLNLIAAPVLALIDTELVPGPALVIALVLTLFMAVRERAGTEWWGVRWALLGRVPGTVAGALAVAALPERGLAVTFAVLVLAAVAISATGLHVAPTRPNLVGAGALSGLMGTATSIGGPPIAMVYQRSAGATLRGTLAGFFAVGATMSLLVLAAVGEFGSRDAVHSLVLLPGLLAGFALSRWTAPVLDAGRTRAAVLAVSAASALSVLLREAL
jgi:uncharacterized membrane protein YfcA